MKLGFNWNPDKAKTFKPKRTHRVGTKRFELHKYAQATLGTGNLHDAVMLPEGEDANEWLAVNTVDFFNEINLLYGVIAEFCTEQACPIMCAGPKYEYMWADGKEIKRPMAVSAPRYVDFLMTWVQNQLDDEKLFPTQLGVPFPPDFVERVQNIFKRLFRVYAHIYYCHFERMSALGAEPHLNTCFKHFVYFVYEFNLIPNRTELSPLQELIDKLLERDQGSSQQRPPPSNNTTNNTTAASGASASTGAAPAVAAGGAVPVQQQAAASEPVSVE
jgi:MOB kinase activator 1